MSDDFKNLLDPVVFAEKILNFKPFPYQAQLLRDPAKKIVVCAGKQVGKSTTIAVKAIHFAVTNPRTVSLIVSATRRMSMLMSDKILEFIENTVLSRSVRGKKRRTKIMFSNGSWIKILPSGRDGRTLRGITAHLVLLDEAALMPVRVVENVIFPMLEATDGICWMLSTPEGNDHTFYRVWNSPEWSKYHWPTHLNPLVSPKFLEEQRRIIGEERYKITYLAERCGSSPTSENTTRGGKPHAD